MVHKITPILDLEALRSFVTGIDSGSFAQAANQLARSTSAISAQLKKLERQCGSELMVKKGRHLQLTHQGEILLGYARRMLALNDETLLALRNERLTGEVRIGLQEDFGESLMPEILGQLKRHHPQVRIVARVDRNSSLLKALNNNQLDMALVWQSQDVCHYSRLIATAPLRWICHPDFDLKAFINKGEPLPLIMFDKPCLIRALATDSLDRAGIPWRIVFISHSLSGIWAAVKAGLGITARTSFGLSPDLSKLSGILPDLGSLGIALEQRDTASQVQRHLTTLIEQRLKSVADI